MTNLANPHSAWSFYHSPGMSGPGNRVLGGWSAKWPEKGQGQWDICHRNHNSKPGIITIVFKVTTVSGQPRFEATEGVSPATIGIQLQRRGDDWDGSTWGGDGRFWCVNRVPLNSVLGMGWQTLICDTSLFGSWVNVWGEPASERTSGFKSLLNDMGKVGLTCGGQSFAHGAYTINGKAKIAVSIVKV